MKSNTAPNNLVKCSKVHFSMIKSDNDCKSNKLGLILNKECKNRTIESVFSNSIYKHMRPVYIVFILFILNFQSGKSENGVLYLSDFIELIKKNHPVVKQSLLIPEFANLELRKAQGAFEPGINSAYERKDLNGTNYYSFFDNQLKIPIWIGEVKGGYQFAYGQNVNPESIIKENGLGSVGLSIPLIKNLITDERRTALQQSKILVSMSEQQQRALLNELFMDAISAYYNWCISYYQFQILDSSVQLATDRYSFILRSASLGDRPAIDTIEALSILQDRVFMKQQAAVEVQNALINLSNFLWNEKGIPVYLNSNILPPAKRQLFLEIISSDSNLQDSINNNPELISAQLKIRMLDIERKLKLESLKPDLRGEYSYLIQPNSNANRNPAQNYKLGVSLKMPLFFIEPLAGYRQMKNKINQANLELDIKRQLLQTKAQSLRNEILTLQQQWKTIESMFAAFKTLQTGEEIRLKNGESSLFLVNNRELKVLETEIKQWSLLLKYNVKQQQLKMLMGNTLSSY